MSKFSTIIAGTMTWGLWGKQLSTQGMVSLLNHCIENGVTSFDHADIYGDYSTEAEFGKAFSESSILRENIQLITKCGIQHTGNARPNKIKHYNYSKEYIIWSVEESLKNLQTEYLDLLLLHRPSPLMQPEEIAEAITKLQTEGKIIDFGVSNFTPSQIELINAKIPVSVNQIEFSITAFEAMHNGVLDQLLTKKIEPMAWSPLGSYYKENTAQTTRVKEVLLKLKEQYNASETQLLLAWILKHPSGIKPVIGTTNKERIIESVDASKIDLKLEDWFEILVASQGHKVP
jgi:predicted oxidoreductase